MRTAIMLFLTVMLLTGCTKEVGKVEYELYFKFASSDESLFNCLIYEKSKHYIAPNEDDIYKGDKSYLLIKSSSTIKNNFEIVLLKTESNQLITINPVKNWGISNALFASNQDVNLLGTIEMNGSYKKKGKKFIVENGTFTINWSNAPDYGEPVQELTGTWSLKRK